MKDLKNAFLYIKRKKKVIFSENKSYCKVNVKNEGAKAILEECKINVFRSCIAVTHQLMLNKSEFARLRTAYWWFYFD